jgi:hypothetical protein
MKQYARFQLRRGTKAQINTWQADSLAKIRSGELAYATDTKHLFFSDGTNIYPVQTLDMAVTYENNIVCYNGEVVIYY